MMNKDEHKIEINGREYYSKYYVDKEIERLNNILNEFELILLEKIEAVENIYAMVGKENAKTMTPHIDILYEEYNNLLKKLKELKEF